LQYDHGMMQEGDRPCQPRTLAQQGVMRVDLCECGQVHVTVGPITIRLIYSQYLRLRDTLIAAAAHLPPPEIAPFH
jgi:hypothetical protein